jgi:hypothetical protein
MSDLFDLHGIFPDSLRWNAETGVLGIGVFNPESGEREVQPVELGNTATFVMDLATRERGYGLIKVGVYDMKLSPVGSPAPAWPGDEEYRPAAACWLWNPTFGELRLEVCSAIFRQAIANVWDKARFAPEAIRGQQPVIRFVDRVDVVIKSLNKTFYGPVVQIVGWAERNDVLGWKERTPTVPPPAAPPLLAVASAPAPIPAPATPTAKKSAKAGKGGAAKPVPEDPPFDDPLPWT